MREIKLESRAEMTRGTVVLIAVSREGMRMRNLHNDRQKKQTEDKDRKCTICVQFIQHGNRIYETNS
jgi:DeoR/GlpR family transcriptional regulator of sugar metabolism